MIGYAILMIIFGLIVMICGFYLVRGNKGDFSNVLLWKTDASKMSVDEVKYAGKITMIVAISPIISGIIAFFFEDSIIPIIVLFVLLISLLILSIKLFK